MLKIALLPLLLLLSGFVQAQDVRVGSKKFTESVVLGELAVALAQDVGASAVHKSDLGGTRVLWNALLGGDIDLYPEYTGTITQELLDGFVGDEDALRARLLEIGVHMGAPLGFNNTYAIGMKAEKALELGIERISDLARFPDLRCGFGNEFLDRADGWPGLRDAYGLQALQTTGLDHDLAYRGLDAGSLDLMDAYSTDADVVHYGLKLLRDDANYFPEYQAVYLYRTQLVNERGEVVKAIERLAGTLDETRMGRLNSLVKIGRRSERAAAAAHLGPVLGIAVNVNDVGFWARLWNNTRDHLMLVLISLSAATLLAIPLGIAAARHPRLGTFVLGTVGILQTIPSLALLVFMIPLLGIGAPPAIVALFLYSLLPIVRNTHAGLTGISPELLESADALGLSRGARLRLIELPLASLSILAGVQTAAVINVGTATLGALIGAGGYGQPILTGIRLDNAGLILEGAVPAALLALTCQGLFALVSRIIVPRGLRLAPEGRS
ncbi:MAG: osmoprotectant transport system permease protein [Planctomycetota bacterium]|jgi:osmoprotectant transport system permease protein